MIFHQVKPGETLTSIARDFGTTPAALIAYNGIPNPENLAVGQCIVIVYPEITHTVRSGESVYSISELYGISLNALYRNNPQLGAMPNIYPGEVLVIALQNNRIGSFETGGYAYLDSSMSLIDSSMPFMNYLMPFTYGFTESGDIVGIEDERLIESAHRYGRKCFMHISTLTDDGYFSNELSNVILTSEPLQERLLDNILRVIEEKGYDGLDIDFEFVYAEDAPRYADFIGKARRRLNSLGLEVFAALAPKTSDEQRGLLYEGHLYREIGEAADAVLLMTYEWGYTYGPPLPVSPIDSVRRVLDYAVTRIPPEKIFLGMSNYGYDWPLPYVKGETMAQSLSTDEALLIASANGAEIRYDTVSEAPYYNYILDGTVHEVWFEDARSIAARLRLCEEYGFRGCLYWNLSRRNVQNLLMINQLVSLPE